MQLNQIFSALVKHAGENSLRVKNSFIIFSHSFASHLGKKQNLKKLRSSDWENLSWDERLAQTVTPLWTLSYEEQLKWKQDQQHKVLLEMMNQINQDISPTLPCSTGDLPFSVLPIVSSPVKDGYRNKSTFSVNKGIDGNPKTVGFYIGTGKGRDIVCVRGDHLLNMPWKHKLVGRCYEEFIRMSQLKPCILFHDGGNWREITVRTNSAGNTMAIVYFHPQTLTSEEKDVHKAALVEYFTEGPGAVCQLDSLYFQETTMTRCTREESPYQLLHGLPHIYEEILGFRFRISADSFFQVNSAAAQAMYKILADFYTASKKGTLLDVCCGTGVIGISLSPYVNKVIGIELIEQAVKDANYNAALNCVQNCQFLSGKAEVVLPKIMPNLCPEGELMAVVNPSRAGLHYRVTRALRNHTAIKRLIYISCKPQGEAMRNFRELCGRADFRKKFSGEPFKPILAVPVDMFPHTSHCELVLVFER